MTRVLIQLKNGEVTAVHSDSGKLSVLIIDHTNRDMEDLTLEESGALSDAEAGYLHDLLEK